MTDQPVRRTEEEIQALKDNWLEDPRWDIEDEEGFEAHREELLAFHNEMRAKWETKREERDNKRIEKVMLKTGVGKADRELLLSLSTWSEIDACLTPSVEDGATQIQAALVRATLLQAAQLKRIADALEDMADGNSLANSAKIWGAGE